MKKLLVILGASLMALTVISADLLAAQGHGLNPYRTPEFVRNPGVVAANDSDLLATATYNPAGFTNFEDGFFVGVGNIIILKSNEMKTDSSFGPLSDTYEQDEPSWLVPSFALAYKTGKAAIFTNFEVIDGGGSSVYDLFPVNMGAAFTGKAKLEAESSWKQFKVGGSFDLIDMVSVTGGVRYIMADKTSKLTAKETLVGAPSGTVLSDSETAMDGQAGFFGINISPVKEALINITYFTKATVYGETKNNISGAKAMAQDVVPSYFTVGASYFVLPELEVSAGFNYVYTAEEKYGTSYLFQYQDNALEMVLGADYKVNELITASAGFAYKMAGGCEETYQMSTEAPNPDLDVYIIGLGAKITPMAGLNVNVGLMKAFFQEGENVAGTITYNRDAWLGSLGVDYKI